MEKTFEIPAVGHYLTKPPQRFCLACEKPIHGRSDKKFCHEVCRNGYNNRLNTASTNLVRNINNALRKNRRILESCFAQQEIVVTISSDELQQKGFAFRYSTHQFTNKKGNTYFFCYDIGYVMLAGKYLVVRKRFEL